MSTRSAFVPTALNATGAGGGETPSVVESVQTSGVAPRGQRYGYGAAPRDHRRVWAERWKWLNMATTVSVEIHRESDPENHPSWPSRCSRRP